MTPHPSLELDAQQDPKSEHGGVMSESGEVVKCPRCGGATREEPVHPDDQHAYSEEWVAICVRSGEEADHCPGERRSGEERRQDGVMRL